MKLLIMQCLFNIIEEKIMCDSVQCGDRSVVMFQAIHLCLQNISIKCRDIRRIADNNIVARMWRLYKTGIGLTTGFIGSHTVTITVYTLYTRSSL
jgi:hypothetical protein